MSSTPALDPSRFAAIDQAIDNVVAAGKMPGAVFRLERAGESHRHVAGRQTFDAHAPAITPDTVFDAASLTKVMATAPSVMILVDEGRLDIEQPVASLIPECRGGGKDSITLRHLLTHTSGLPAGLPPKPAWRGEAAALALACAEQVTHPPGTFFRYSDINFTLLGVIVRRVSGMPLDEFARRRIFEPLGMRNTGYRPLDRNVPAAIIAPTQKFRDAPHQPLHDDLVAGQELRGVVHDPTVRFMGGVGGSAGLFTTAGDVARYARMIVGGGEAGGVRILSREAVARMTSVQSPPGVDVRRGLGWDIDSPFARPRGITFPLGSFGHTGFTGCILWIDPFSKTFFVFLSNRVYPDDRANILDLYGRLGTRAAASVAGFDFGNVSGALPPLPQAAEK